MQPLFLTEEQIKEILDLKELLSAMEEALIDFSAGRVNQPLRTVLAVPEQAGWFGVMPAIHRDVIGAKLVTVFPKNAERGLHTHLATIQLFSSETGEVLAILDGRWITACRTAAVSALATRELSNANSRVLAILGSGVQARTHYQALKRIRNFEDVRIWSRNPDHAARFAREIGGGSMSAEQAVRGADVVVTVTNATEPILRGSWLKDGAHINAVGAVGLKFREMDNISMQNAAVVVESREAALRESADIVGSGATIYAELGEILAGAKSKPRGPTTIYKSLGIAVEDVAAARLVYKKRSANQSRRTNPAHRPQPIVICSRFVKSRDSTSVDYQLNWRKLQQVGLNAYEARSYLVLMGHPRFKALELAARAHVPRQKIYEVLDSLVEKGFAQVVQEKTKLFSAVDPTLAIPGYLARRSKVLQNELTEQARLATGLIEDLRAAFQEGQDGRGTLDFLNLVNDPTQTAIHYRRMLGTVASSYSEFSRPPFAVDPLDEQLVKDAAERGIACRLLIEAGPIDTAHRERLNDYRECGVEIRFLDRLPLKLALFDGKCGLVALLDPVLTRPSWTAVVFEHDGFAEAMAGLFESYWCRGRRDTSSQ